MTTQAYLQFGHATWPPTPMQTTGVPVKTTEQPQAGKYNVTGYGPRIPSRYKVQYLGRWRRVYIANYGNSGTAYIGPRGDWIATVTIDESEE